MKNPKITYFNNNRFFKYKLFKTKIYKNNLEIFIQIKKNINIIYKYNIFNKKILLINNNTTLTKKLLKLISENKHLFLTKFIFKNKIICYNYLNTKNFNKQKVLNNKIHLIVVLNYKKDNSNITSFIKKPILFFNFQSFNNFEYLNQKIQDVFIYSLLNITFKKIKKNF